jgi:hypothetical protein
LGVALDFRVCKEESHGDESADNHGATSAPEVLGATHVACQDGTRDGTQVGDGVVAPDFAVCKAAELSATGADVDWEEDVVERVGETNEELQEKSVEFL